MRALFTIAIVLLLCPPELGAEPGPEPESGPVAGGQAKLYLTLPPDPVSHAWRSGETTVPVGVLPEPDAVRRARNMSRFAPDTVRTRTPPPGHAYVWRVVLLIYPSIDIEQTVGGVTSRFTHTLSAAEISEVETAFESMVTGIHEGSNHEARIQSTVVVVGRTLTSLASFGADIYWPDAAVTAPELIAYCADGKADSALVYWPAKNHTTQAAVNNPYWGLSYGAPASYTYGVGYSTVSNVLSPMQSGYYPGEVMIHEWMHPTTDYYHVVWGFAVPNLDSAGSYRPCPACANYALVPGDGWMAFYRDILRGTVWNPAEGRYEGLPPAAWRSGTPTNFSLPTAAGEWALYE